MAYSDNRWDEVSAGRVFPRPVGAARRLCTRLPGMERERARLARLEKVRSDAAAQDQADVERAERELMRKPRAEDWEQERTDVARVRSLSRQYFEENQARLRRLWEGVGK